MGRARTGLLAAALLVVASPATAQLWEVQLGAVGSYGVADGYGPGAGILAGLAPGRLAYAGLRWTHFRGRTSASPTPGGTIHNRAQTLTLDLGLMIPAGPVELLPGLGIGAAFIAQESRVAGAVRRFRTTELHVTPGLAAQVRAGGGFSFIPEIQYSLARHPRVPFPADHGGLVLTLRAVVTLEIDRIRQ